MVSVEEACRIIFSTLYKPPVATLPLAEAAGYVLAEPVYADRDFPPFDRVMMDGIAVALARLKAGQRTFAVETIQPAGTPQKRLKDVNKCIEVMTGAMLPKGTDVVIRYEDLVINNGEANVQVDTFEACQHIHARGRDVKEEAEILTPGTLLAPAEIALLASVGKAEVLVRQLPNVAVISTGNELVDVTDTPELHQIRRSNSYALSAALKLMGLQSEIHHLPDDKDEMEEGLKRLLNRFDVLILSGGVSKGKFDFVPETLEKLHVRKLIHRVSQRPGKPFWFGASQEDKIVFALPGNPVSTYLCFYRYIRPWLGLSMGTKVSEWTAVLAEDFEFQPSLTCFLQVKVSCEEGKLWAYPRPGQGSGDFANLSEVDGFLQLPAEKQEFKRGEAFPYIPFR